MWKAIKEFWKKNKGTILPIIWTIIGLGGGATGVAVYNDSFVVSQTPLDPSVDEPSTWMVFVRYQIPDTLVHTKSGQDRQFWDNTSQVITLQAKTVDYTLIKKYLAADTTLTFKDLIIDSTLEIPKK